MFAILYDDFFSLLLKKWHIIAISALVGALVLFGYSLVPKAQSYVIKSSIMVMMGDEQPGQANADEVLKEKTSSLAYLLKSDTVVNSVMSQLGLSKSSAFDSLTVDPVNDTDIIEINIAGRSSDAIKSVTNGLLSSATQLSKLTGTTVYVVDAGTPGLDEASQVSPSKYLLLGLLIGACLSICYILLRNYLNDSIKNSREMLGLYHLPVVALIPKIRGFSKSMPLKDMPGGYIRQIEKLGVYAAAKSSGGTVIGITGAGKGEGKSSVSARLAEYLAGLQKTVLYLGIGTAANALPWQLERLNIEQLDKLGLNCETAAAMCAKADHLNVILIDTSGDANNQMRSNALGALLAQARQHNDYIVLDMPSVDQAPDVVFHEELAADKLFLVVEPYRSKNADVQAAIQMAKATGVEFYGCVFNKYDGRPMVK